jgi:hypothetical protein
MNYSYNLNSENKTITVITTGNYNARELETIEFQIRRKANDLKYKIIFDYRMSKISISITDFYYWFSNKYDSTNLRLKLIQSAYLVNDNDWDAYTFFECTSANNSIPVKVFLEENAANDWLKIN